MATPIYNLPYPTDYDGDADVPLWLKDLADATEEALDDVAGSAGKIDEVQVNGTALPIVNKAVNIDLTGKQDVSNLITSLSSSSTDTEYPSAKCVYDLIGDINSVLDTINGEVV